jgi:hypothetical protein
MQKIRRLGINKVIIYLKLNDIETKKVKKIIRKRNYEEKDFSDKLNTR